MVDIPQLGLKVGDIGTIIDVYTPMDFEVEFVKAEDDCELVSLTADQLTKVSGPRIKPIISL
jgi:hypothetical protein